MSEKIACFLLVESTRARRSLRRYSDRRCRLGLLSYHDAVEPFDEVPHERETALLDDDTGLPEQGDPRWPRLCSCRYEFTAADYFQIFREVVYVRADEQPGDCLLRDAPAGAMWNAWWLARSPGWRGPDGQCLTVKTPGGEWHIDGRASNCTLPTDDTHKCWVRHGEPPRITVDKNGATCSAGSGAISIGDYHGFLRDGQLDSVKNWGG